MTLAGSFRHVAHLVKRTAQIVFALNLFGVNIDRHLGYRQHWRSQDVGHEDSSKPRTMFFSIRCSLRK